MTGITQLMARTRAGIIVETCFQLAARESGQAISFLRRPKTRTIAPWRFAALWLAAKAGGVSSYQIALHTGMDRAAVTHGIQQCGKLMEKGGAFFLAVDALKGEVMALAARGEAA